MKTEKRRTRKMALLHHNLRRLTLRLVAVEPSKSMAGLYLAALLMTIGLADALAEPDQTISRSMTVEYEDRIVAARGDTSISLKDFHGRMLQIPADKRPGVLSDPERVADLINGVLLLHYFSEQEVKDTESIDDDIRVAMYYRAAEVLAQARQNELIQNELLSDYTDRAKEIYLTNPERFKTPEKVDFSHILLSSENLDASEREEKLDSLRARILAGESIEELAPEHSDDPSVEQNNGQFIAVDLNTLDPAFREGLADLSEGELGVVESTFGTHLVRLDKRYPPRIKPFEEVAESLEEEARRSHAERIRQRILADFFESPLELEPGAVEEIVDLYVD